MGNKDPRYGVRLLMTYPTKTPKSQASLMLLRAENISGLLQNIISAAEVVVRCEGDRDELCCRRSGKL